MPKPHTVVSVSVEQERGATYASDKYAVYAEKLESPSSVNYRYEGQTYRNYITGGFDTPGEALGKARELFPGIEVEVHPGTSYRPVDLPSSAPAWFDPMAAGEAW